MRVPTGADPRINKPNPAEGREEKERRREKPKTSIRISFAVFPLARRSRRVNDERREGEAERRRSGGEGRGVEWRRSGGRWRWKWWQRWWEEEVDLSLSRAPR